MLKYKYQNIYYHQSDYLRENTVRQGDRFFADIGEKASR